MKLTTTLREALRLYKKNLPDLLLTLLLELVLRAICLAPMLFLAAPDIAWGALLCVPLYLLIALPARQNVALAMQDMMNGGRVFSARLISTENYGAKLLRGLAGTGKLLLWSLLPLAGIGAMLAIYLGVVDGFTALRLFSQFGGGSTVDGITLAVAVIAALLLLPVIGCAVHSGHRHAVALGNKALVRGHRGQLVALWVAGLALLLPFAAVLLVTMGDWALSLIQQLQVVMMGGKLSLSLGNRMYVLVAGAVLLVLPVMPLKNLLPAVFLRQVKEKNDAAA